VVFTYHIEPAESLAAKLGSQYPLVLVTSKVEPGERQGLFDRFQTDAEVKLMIGTIGVAGEGITLTAASHIVFCEFDWTPGKMSQAEARCHRIGQYDALLVQCLGLEDSLDAAVAKRVVEKQEVIEAALDKEPSERLPKFDGFGIEQPKAATEDLDPSDIDELADALTSEQTRAIHQGLQLLAAVCDGAIEKDFMGFNKLDTRIGRSLASCKALTPRQAVLGHRLLRKYLRQLPADINEVLFPGRRRHTAAAVRWLATDWDQWAHLSKGTYVLEREFDLFGVGSPMSFPGRLRRATKT
jgi:hypothetical protein